jgi:ADP-L-glycero-D-manno-heptose 6-epimerase
MAHAKGVTTTAGRVLVTGGAGFIGSALVWALNQRGQEAIVISDFLEEGKTWNGVVPIAVNRDEKSRNLQGLRYAEYVEADVLRSRLLSDPSAFGRFHTVFHLGACSSTTETNTAYLTDNNVAYTKDLARWAMAQQARFIYASSAATYGDGSAGMDDHDPKLTRLRPLNRYGESKHAFDLHAQREGWLDRIVGLKYFNVFGPNEDHKGEMRSLVRKAFQQIQETGCVKLFKSCRPDVKDGEQQRDFLYVKDAVEMTLFFAYDNPKAAGLFNIGSGEANTWITLASAIFEALTRPPKITFIEMPVEIRDKYQYFTRADITKLRAAGYARPMTPLREAVRDYVQDYLISQRKLGR